MDLDRIFHHEVRQAFGIELGWISQALQGKRRGEVGAQHGEHLFQVPFLREARRSRENGYLLSQDALDDAEYVFTQVVAAEDALALPVDDLALLVHHVVVLEHPFPDLEVLLFHFLLSALHRPGDQTVLDGNVLLEPQAIHEAVDALSTEDAQEVVLQGDDELARSGVALAAGTAPKLVVDPPGFVPLGTQNEQSPHVDDAIAQLDVRAPTGHVGGYGDGPWLSGLSHDRRLFGVVLGVQDLVRDAPALQHLREPF